MATAATPLLTPEEYLGIERKAQFRSEYIDGQMYAMSGATRNHVRIVGNVQSELRAQLRGTRCEALSVDSRVHSKTRRFFTYPDVVVSCSSETTLDEEDDTLTDATLIVEVLSPLTKNYDRGEKFEYYRSLPSFSEYLLIHQDRVYAEQYSKQPDGTWVFREYGGNEDQIVLPSVGCVLSLGSLCERVVFKA